MAGARRSPLLAGGLRARMRAGSRREISARNAQIAGDLFRRAGFFLHWPHRAVGSGIRASVGDERNVRSGATPGREQNTMSNSRVWARWSLFCGVILSLACVSGASANGATGRCCFPNGDCGEDRQNAHHELDSGGFLQRGARGLEDAQSLGLLREIFNRGLRGGSG